MDASQYREVLIGLDRALFVFHEAGNAMSEREQSLETAILSIRRDVLRAWAGYPANPYDPALRTHSSPPIPPPAAN